MTANEPLAMFAMAALDEELAAALEVAVREELPLVDEAVRVGEVESVTLAAVVGTVLEVTVAMVDKLVEEAEEVILVELLEEVGVYEGLEDTLIVVVVAPLTLETAEELVVEPPPVMWNGKDHWKMVGSESHEIWIP